MSVKEQVTKTLETLSEDELRQVAEYLAFLKFRSRLSPLPPLDAVQVAELYAEFAEEDRFLAEEGLEDYMAGLHAEDTQ